MPKKRIHIISFDVPFPPDYGGAIDVFYRIKALHELGLEITLHCFEYGRGMPEELKKHVTHIHYYRRWKTIFSWFRSKPFIVSTRSSKNLINRLALDDDPVLFEGLHSTFFLADERLKNRIKIVRTHNIEHEYYQHLADKTTGYKRRFFNSEARKLKKYESILSRADFILAINEKESEYFEQYNEQTFCLPASLPSGLIHHFEHTKPYFLFHGNLSVAENDEGARWLIEQVFAPLEWCDKLLIAGKNPSDQLIRFCQSHGVMLTANPDDLEMSTVLELARVHVFYSAQDTGVKLKLLAALQTKGHVLCNSHMIKGSALETVCTVADIPKEYQRLIQEKIKEELPFNEQVLRKEFLLKNYDTKENCRKVILPLLEKANIVDSK